MPECIRMAFSLFWATVAREPGQKGERWDVFMQGGRERGRSCEWEYVPKASVPGEPRLRNNLRGSIVLVHWEQHRTLIPKAYEDCPE